MTFDKFTIKAQEAIQEAVNLVTGKGTASHRTRNTCWPVSSKWEKMSRISSFREIRESTAGKSNGTGKPDCFAAKGPGGEPEPAKAMKC